LVGGSFGSREAIGRASLALLGLPLGAVMLPIGLEGERGEKSFEDSFCSAFGGGGRSITVCFPPFDLFLLLLFPRAQVERDVARGVGYYMDRVRAALTGANVRRRKAVLD